MLAEPHDSNLCLSGFARQPLLLQSFSDQVDEMKYKVVLQKTDEGFSVSCPGLPGCWSQGLTEGEALTNIQDAIKEYLTVRDDLLKDGDIREVEVAG